MGRNLTHGKRCGIDRLFRDEKGITTTAMAVSIMLSLALVFTGAQAYKATSASAEVQEVADVCALAAESEVGEFMVCVKVCDATLLSLSLLSGASFGLSIVCACVPPLQTVSTSLAKIGEKALNARNKFAKKAEKGLNTLQKALPFLAAAAASSVASSNNFGAMEADYLGCALLVPQKGTEIRIGGSDELEDCAKDIKDDLSDIQTAAKKAEEAMREANNAKKEAFDLDCGNSPGYCQYERAGRFSWMPASANPLYSNVDAWSFSVAFDRAKAYYSYREGCEPEPTGSVQDKASYFVRMKFYSYAFEKLETEGYVNGTSGSFDANFPKLFRNTSEFKQTSLYRGASFPVSFEEGDEKAVMHAWSGCPAAANITGYDCVAALDGGAYQGCPTCNFSVESLGNVASASTNISNGFEYHYERIRQLAEKYEEAINDASPLKNAVEDGVTPLLESLKDALSSLGACRISADPCGSAGAIAIVVNKGNQSVSSGFETTFVRGSGTLGARAAVSGAALVEDTSDDTSDVINTFLDDMSGNGGAAIGGAAIALDLWSGILKAYANGQKAVEKSISSAISGLSLGTLTGLGDWAATAFNEVVKTVGLEPANLNALKPATLNTGHLVEQSSDAFAVNYKKIRAETLSASSSTGTVLGGVASWITGKIDAAVDGDMTIAEIEFPIGDKRIPISVSIPESVTSTPTETISGALRDIENLVFGDVRGKIWQ